MAVFSKEFLSESTDGRPKLLNTTGSPGSNIHTTGSAAIDEIWIYAYNDDSAAVNLIIEWGGVTTTDRIEQSIVSQGGLILVVPGLVLTNNLVVRAYASTGNKITLTGFVNRIT